VTMVSALVSLLRDRPVRPVVGMIGVAAVGVLAAVMARAADAPATGPHGEKLVPMDVKLPRPLFQGTPKNVKQAATLEKYDERPRAPFMVPAGVTLLSFKKKVTASDENPVIGELNMITDGDKEGADGSYVELGPDKQWVQIDLGAPADIYSVVIWHYHGEARVYHAVIVQVSDDPTFAKGVTTVFNNDFANSAGQGVGKQLEYIDDYRGKLIDARNEKGEPTRGRYVRLYSKGNTSNDLNHYVEVEVFGKAAP